MKNYISQIKNIKFHRIFEITTKVNVKMDYSSTFLNLFKLNKKFCTNASKIKLNSKLNKQANNYWINANLDNDYMVGYPDINDEDINHTNKLLSKYIHSKNLNNCDSKISCLEIGSGIGRVTTNCLLNICSTIDIVEPYEKFTSNLFSNLSDDIKTKNKIRKIVNKHIQQLNKKDFLNEFSKYQLIFMQWVLEYVDKNDDLINFFNLIKLLLRCSTDNNSYIIIKENVFDEECLVESQGSYIRSKNKFEQIFKIAKLNVIEQGYVSYSCKGAEELFPVSYWILSN